MESKTKKFCSSAKTKAIAAGFMLLNTGLALAQATPGTPEASMDEGKTTILALIAVAGAAGVAIALASTGWEVGAKLIKRMRGKA
ncbi:hypothetical protein [Herminiimonas contaminans]|uniref:Virion coat protein B n=1 Tax=Herminiimonas contaminans TaxID=1111140 RepID=A0ABS0EY66_9BURK|nr:hypothetical protein [Herminiimonas contaminans]MBF8179800.1 hypothetical protein [Herminiimonas contaminans]